MKSLVKLLNRTWKGDNLMELIKMKEDQLFNKWKLKMNITGSFDTDGVINTEV